MNEQMMILADGSATEFESIKRMSVKDFLTKYENYISDLEFKNKHGR